MTAISSESLKKLADLKNELGVSEEATFEVMHEEVRAQLLNFYLISQDEIRTNPYYVREPLSMVLAQKYEDEGSLEEALSEPLTSETSTTLADIRYCQSLLEPFSPDTPANEMTVCIPVALLHESQETLLAMIQQIKKAASNVNGGVNVLVWSNAKYDGEEDKRTVKELAEYRYSQLRDLLAPYESDTMRIITAMETLPADEVYMSAIRSHYMDAVVGEVIDGAIHVEHPVMWIDADTTYLSENVLEATRRELLEHPLNFSHPDIDYDLDWTKGVPARDMDVASKVLLIDEMARRASKRMAINTDTRVKERNYAEESGMSFTMLSYLASSGVDTDDPINETARLIHRHRDFFWYFGYMNQASDLAQKMCSLYGASINGLMRVPKALQEKNPLGVHWLNEAKMHLSARRLYEGIKSHGIKSIEQRTESINGVYELFTDLKTEGDSDLRLDVDELNEVLLRTRDRAGRKIAKKVVTRMLANKNLTLPH